MYVCVCVRVWLGGPRTETLLMTESAYATAAPKLSL